MARRALGHRRQADRLRQARRRCRCATWRSSCSNSSTTWWTIWAAARRSSTCTRSCGKAPAPTGSSRCYRETGDLRAVVQDIVEQTKPGAGVDRRGDEARHRSVHRPMKVGLLCGREYSFPPAFIARVNEVGRAARHHRGDGEAGRHEDGRAGGIPRDRRPHFARGGVLPRRAEARRAAGQLRHQQPVLVDGGRQVLQLLGDGQARGGDPEDGAAAAEGLSDGRRSHAESLRNLEYPGRLGRAARLRRAARRS